MPRHLSAALALALLVGPAQAQVPRTFLLEGRLTDTSGSPLGGPTLAVTARLFPVDSGGTEFHTELDPAVAIDAAGRFQMTLGDLNDGNPALDPADFVGSVWAEFEVGGQVLAPRLPVAPAPYAVTAAVAEGVTGVDFLSMGNQRLINVTDAIAATDVVNKGQVDARVGSLAGLPGGASELTEAYQHLDGTSLSLETSASA